MNALKTTQEIINYGSSIFKSEEIFFEWINTASLAMHNHKPVDLLTTKEGQALVLAELDKLNFSSFTI